MCVCGGGGGGVFKKGGYLSRGIVEKGNSGQFSQEGGWGMEMEGEFKIIDIKIVYRITIQDD